jgi:hypothetical protein
MIVGSLRHFGFELAGNAEKDRFAPSFQVTHTDPLFSPSLLKTFSINPFHGQYPNVLVRISPTPITPKTHRKPPEKKKAKIIRMTPITNREIASPLPTFLLGTNDSIFSPFRYWIILRPVY